MNESIKQLQGLKILVIDDDELVRLTLQRILQKKGYTVFEADNGAIGIDVFKAKSPDIVLTDMLMPEKEGLETISEILKYKPDTKIIAMSGGGQAQNMTFLQLASKVGAHRTIGKPIKPDELFRAIDALT